MARFLRLRPKARSDIFSAARWYESERIGLGVAFLADIDNALRRISDAPLHYPVLAATTRWALMLRFPYAVYFRAGARIVDVIGVLHTSRDPQRWQLREPAEFYVLERQAA